MPRAIRIKATLWLLPMGKFSEILAEAHWSKNKWKAGVCATYSLKGYDTSAGNWGGNINIPYINRPIELNDFGHTIGPGTGNNAFCVMLRESHRLCEKSRIDAFVEAHFRYNTCLNEPKAQIVIGIRSQLCERLPKLLNSTPLSQIIY